MRTAQLLGDLHLKDARIPISPSIGTLREASVDITVHAHDIAIAGTGKLGAGTVKLSGSIATDGASLTGGKVTMTLRKVSPIGAVQPVIDADVTAKLARRGETWTADLVVDKGFVKIASTKGERLKDVGLPPDLTIGRGKRPVRTGPLPPPPAPIVIAHIVLHDTKVESDEFRTTIRGELTATADTRAVGLTGKIEALGGDLDLFDRRYIVDTAAVYFDGTTDPLLQIRFTHDFPDVETITEVRGRLSKPVLSLSSNPGTYTKSQLLGFLLGGEPTGDPNSAGARDKATAAGESLIAGQIGNYVKKALPFNLDVLRYEAAGVTSSAAITVGSWVTHTLFVAFREHLSPRPDENSGEATVEYWLTQRLEVETTIGDRSYDGIDLLWRKRF
jgi:autotransporter translocation and assembly factor TamB